MLVDFSHETVIYRFVYRPAEEFMGHKNVPNTIKLIERPTVQIFCNILLCVLN